jgi:hypothetical protein
MAKPASRAGIQQGIQYVCPAKVFNKVFNRPARVFNKVFKRGIAKPASRSKGIQESGRKAFAKPAS